MMMKKFSRFHMGAAIAVLLSGPVMASNTYFLTDRNGQVQFPLSPPNKATGGPGAIDNMTIGATKPAPGTFSQLNMGGGLPTIASGACGTTTNGAVVAGSTDQSGQITIGVATTTTCAVSFSKTLAPVPKACTISPMNAAAAAAGTAGGFVGSPSGTGFTITGLALASTNWSFHCL